MTFLIGLAAVGILAVTALAAAGVVIAALCVLAITLVRTVGVVVAMGREWRDRPVARARNRWSSALRRHW